MAATPKPIRKLGKKIALELNAKKKTPKEKASRKLTLGEGNKAARVLIKQDVATGRRASNKESVLKATTHRKKSKVFG